MNKLEINAKYTKNDYVTGFKEAFKLIDNNLQQELDRIQAYPFMGERIMTLKIYKNRIQDMLKEMEQENV